MVLSQVFPPKTSIGTTNLVDRIERMTSLNPTWVHVTWGAGGSTQERSLDLAGATQGLGVDACLHLTCTNMEQTVLDKALKVSKILIPERAVNMVPSRTGASGVADRDPGVCD